MGPKPFEALKVLVLDEADQLLDRGFRKEIMELLAGYVPAEKQTLLFSATMPAGLRAVMSKAMRPDFTTVDCIGDDSQATEGAGATHAHDQVQQHHMITDTDESIIQSSFDVLRTIVEQGDIAQQDPATGLETTSPPKLMVFLPTANLTKFYASLWQKVHEKKKRQNNRYMSYEMHSRKSQSQRSKVQALFHKTPTGILFSSDVSARGVDYPGVTHVVQIGAPPSVEQYVHRLGRTGRAGKKGTGILILTPFEKDFLKSLQQGGVACHHVDQNESWSLVKSTPAEQEQVNELLHRDATKKLRDPEAVCEFDAGKAYQSWLGNLMGGTIPKGTKRRGKDEYVKFANGFAKAAGYTSGVMPGLAAQTVGKMGLKGVAGINIVKKAYTKQNPLPKKKRNPLGSRPAPVGRNRNRN